MSTHFPRRKIAGVRYLRKLLEAFAMIDYEKSEPAWKHKAQLIHVYIFNTLSVIILSAHLFSTVTRSIRYIPEFCQVLFEDAVIITAFYIRLTFRARRKQLKFLVDYMEHSFSTADQRIIDKCHQKQFTTDLVFVTIMTTAFVSGSVEMFHVSEVEYAIRQNVYQTKYPGRRLLYNLRFPFLDESEYWNFVILYAFEAFMTINFIMWTSLCISVTPSMAYHLRGQYEVIATHVEKIGTQHRDVEGNLIFYTNIRNNEYTTFKQNRKMTCEGSSKMESKTGVQYNKYSYEREYLRQIIQFHKELVEFKTKVCIYIEHVICVSEDRSSKVKD